MKTNKKIIALVEHGFKPSTILKLKESQITMLYDRLMEQSQPVSGSTSGSTTGTTTTTPTTPNKTEMTEKAVSKKQQEFFGVVRGIQKGDIPKKGKAGKASEKMSEKDVKDFASTKHKGLPMKKETKEYYDKYVTNSYANAASSAANNIKMGLNWDSLGESFNYLVDKHITPKISKKDFVDFIIETQKKMKDSDTKEKEKTKPGTKEKEKTKPGHDTPYKPKPGPEKAPKAKKMETTEDTKTAPVKPKTPVKKPDTKPRPDTPYRPKPGPEKAPKADKSELPNWLTYSSIGLNIK